MMSRPTDKSHGAAGSWLQAARFAVVGNAMPESLRRAAILHTVAKWSAPHAHHMYDSMNKQLRRRAQELRQEPADSTPRDRGRNCPGRARSYGLNRPTRTPHSRTRPAIWTSCGLACSSTGRSLARCPSELGDCLALAHRVDTRRLLDVTNGLSRASTTRAKLASARLPYRGDGLERRIGRGAAPQRSAGRHRARAGCRTGRARQARTRLRSDDSFDDAGVPGPSSNLFPFIDSLAARTEATALVRSRDQLGRLWFDPSLRQRLRTLVVLEWRLGQGKAAEEAVVLSGAYGTASTVGATRRIHLPPRSKDHHRPISFHTR